jgi:hypothetical protein
VDGFLPDDRDCNVTLRKSTHSNIAHQIPWQSLDIAGAGGDNPADPVGFCRAASEEELHAMAEPTRVDVSRRTVLKGIAGAAGLISIPAIIAACSTTSSSGAAASGGAGASGAASVGNLSVGSYNSDPAPKQGMTDINAAFKTATGFTVAMNTVDHNTFQDQISNYLGATPDTVYTWFSGFRMKFFADKGFNTPIDDVWAKVKGNFTPGFANAVVAAVLIHEASDIRRRRWLLFAEVVVAANGASRQQDAPDHVAVDGANCHAVDPTGGVLRGIKASRLSFGDAVGSRPQTVKSVASIHAGRSRDIDRMAQVIGPGQRHGLLPIEFRSKRMMRERWYRRQRDRNRRSCRHGESNLLHLGVPLFWMNSRKSWMNARTQREGMDEVPSLIVVSKK